MSELQAEIVIRLMSDGKVGYKYSRVGPMILYGMLGVTQDGIRRDYEKMAAESRIVEATMPAPRILPEDVPPMMGNNGKG